MAKSAVPRFIAVSVPTPRGASGSLGRFRRRPAGLLRDRERTHQPILHLLFGVVAFCRSFCRTRFFVFRHSLLRPTPKRFNRHLFLCRTHEILCFNLSFCCWGIVQHFSSAGVRSLPSVASIFDFLPSLFVAKLR